MSLTARLIENAPDGVRGRCCACEMRSFDISPDGKQILFDRVRRNPGIVLIDLAR